MFCLLLSAAALVIFFLARNGKLGAPPWAARPEADARTILAERFARGDISSDEFLERASVLNWNPGADDGRRRGGANR